MLIIKLPPRLALVAVFLLLAAATSRAQVDSLPELIRRVKPSVVSVITYNAKGEVALTGSGFFIRPGQVLTNLHVVEGAHHAEVRTFDAPVRYSVGSPSSAGPSMPAVVTPTWPTRPCASRAVRRSASSSPTRGRVDAGA